MHSYLSNHLSWILVSKIMPWNSWLEFEILFSHGNNIKMLVRLLGKSQSSFNPWLNIIQIILMNYLSVNPLAYSDFKVDRGYKSCQYCGYRGWWANNKGEGSTKGKQVMLKKIQITVILYMWVRLFQEQRYILFLSNNESSLYGLSRK